MERYPRDGEGSGRRSDAQPSASSRPPVQTVPAHVLSSFGNAARARSDESWVEISSRPSSSSLSSADPDEIVTTGLRVGRVPHGRPHRRPRRGPLARSNLQPGPTGSRSSQDEYEETESEEDRIMTSSNENLPCSPAAGPFDLPSPRADAALSDAGNEQAVIDDAAGDEDDDDEDAEEDDDDENSTALGVLSHEAGFTPQPNVFSHPPPAQPASGSGSGSASYFPSRERRPSRTGPAHPARRPQHSPYNIISPSHQADHDAALRASLSTLLSCAAAARGLSKPSRVSSRAGPPHTIQPATLQIVPESVVMGGGGDAGDAAEDDVGRSDPSEGRPVAGERSGRPQARSKSKRKAPASPVKSGKERVVKKPKRAFEDGITPSLLTWVLSAGVVVLVGAISFSAGYAMGREVGKAEAGMIDVGEGRSCGRDAVRGLRRFRWSSASAGAGTAR